MGELLDRPLQRELLQRLMAAYPNLVEVGDLRRFAADNVLNVNISYLSEHGLVAAKHYSMLSEGQVLGMAKITAKGIDFLADDGGLGAILGVVTIKLHEETLRQLISSKVEESDLPQTQKQRLLDQLRELPAETTKHLAMQLVDAGLKNWPTALLLLQRVLGQ